MGFGSVDYTAVGGRQAKNVVLYGTDGTALIITAGALTVDTELPAARLAADNLALPTAPDVLALPMLYDSQSANLDMMRSAKGNTGTVGSAPTGTGIAMVAMYGPRANANASLNPLLVTDAIADGVTEASGNIAAAMTSAIMRAYNETSYDRWRNNIAGTLLASAARTATNSTAQQVNYNGKSLHAIINVTSITSSPSVVPTIEAFDSVAGDYYTLLTGVAIVGTGKTVLKVGPGFLAAANAVAQDMVPRLWRVTLTHGNADSISYSVAYALNCS